MLIDSKKGKDFSGSLKSPVKTKAAPEKVQNKKADAVSSEAKQSKVLPMIDSNYRLMFSLIFVALSFLLALFALFVVVMRR